jgi:uncharacterized protein (DUF58 family)
VSTREPWEFDGVVRLTRVGVTFVIFTVFVGFAGINTGNNSLYIALSLMLGCLLLSGVASKGGLKHLEVALEGVDEAWAMRPAHARLRITNRSRIWNVRDLLIASEQLDAPLLVPLIERGGSVGAHVTFLFTRRGPVHIERVDLYTRYPFGFFLKKRRAHLSGEIVVFPRLLDAGAAIDRLRAVEGEQHRSNRIGPGADIHSFRDYVRGDSLRHIYWKKSASLGRWIIRQTEVDAGRALHIVVDPHRPAGVSEDAFEQMISEAATFLHDALERELEVLLTVPHLSLRSGHDGASTMFRALALLASTPEPVAQAVDRDSVIFSVAADTIADVAVLAAGAGR